jgi:hypothetical protein
MILSLKVANKSKGEKPVLEVWIQEDNNLKGQIIEMLKFFKDNIKIYKIWRIHFFYKITSENPAILLSLFSALQELIPENYLEA